MVGLGRGSKKGHSSTGGCGGEGMCAWNAGLAGNPVRDWEQWREVWDLSLVLGKHRLAWGDKVRRSAWERGAGGRH